MSSGTLVVWWALTLPWSRSAQRKGIGLELTVATARWLADAGMDSMVVWVLTANQQARRFYEALGGEYCQEREVEIGGRGLTEVACAWSDLTHLCTLGEPGE